MKTIDLRIERIVIDGVTLTPVERARLRTALEAQLSDRLSRGAMHGLEAMQAQHGEAALRAPLLMPASATPGQWGRGIADAVLGSLTNGADHGDHRGRGDRAGRGDHADRSDHGVRGDRVDHIARGDRGDLGSTARSSSIASTNGGAQ